MREASPKAAAPSEEPTPRADDERLADERADGEGVQERADRGSRLLIGLRLWALRGILLGLGVSALGALAVWEFESSTVSSQIFADVASEIDWHVAEGPSDQIRFPNHGPFDTRYGYTSIPNIEKELHRQGFETTYQARVSDRFAQLTDQGLNPIYEEKSRAGLRVIDREGAVIHDALRPERFYPSFESIPPLVVETLLFVENRSLLDREHPYRNPTLEWKRLVKAVGEYALSKIGLRNGRPPGGSTLVTQLEKYKHSYEGRTRNPKDKLVQMLSASLRTYLRGRNTISSRERIARDYINSVPLAALPGYGEVHGLGDGLWAWYGMHFARFNQLMFEASRGGVWESREDVLEMASAYRMALSLMLAHRRPSEFLNGATKELGDKTDTYLYLLAQEGLISEEFRDWALCARPELRHELSEEELVFLDVKFSNSTRTHILTTAKIDNLYDLDRFDLEVETTLDRQVQQRISNTLRFLQDPKYVDEENLDRYRLLQKGDPSKVIYSFTLYERLGDKNVLRVQADNHDQPLNINEGSKLDLGSTAKLRTTLTYLEIVAALHEQHKNASRRELTEALENTHPQDALSQFVLRHLRNYWSRPRRRTLDYVLRASLRRRYSASPYQQFMTGGGLHRFHNFNKWDNHRILTVQQSLRNSVNLPLVRMMRDIVYYYMWRLPGVDTKIVADAADPRRLPYLRRFADREGRDYLAQFYRAYSESSSTETDLQTLLRRHAPWTPKQLAVAYLHVHPAPDRENLEAFMRAHREQIRYRRPKLEESLFDEFAELYAPGKFDLEDTAYLSGVHPLELWLLKRRQKTREESLGQLLAQTEQLRQDVYSWLFKPNRKRGQDRRIRMLLEEDAYGPIHEHWRSLGYPFDTLVPSYATALGSSADTPSALATLMGIILNDGVRLPTTRVEALHFAEATPFESHYVHRAREGKRVMTPEVAMIARELLEDVVQNGTAVRARSLTERDSFGWRIGGKTGTGDHRYKVFGPGGRVISERAVNRTATFVFFIEDRFFGTIVAYVPGEQSDDYEFTSSLPVELLKRLAPHIRLLFDKGRSRAPLDLSWRRGDDDDDAIPAQLARSMEPICDSDLATFLGFDDDFEFEDRYRQNYEILDPDYACDPVLEEQLRLEKQEEERREERRERLDDTSARVDPMAPAPQHQERGEDRPIELILVERILLPRRSLQVITLPTPSSAQAPPRPKLAEGKVIDAHNEPPRRVDPRLDAIRSRGPPHLRRLGSALSVPGCERGPPQTT